MGDWSELPPEILAQIAQCIDNCFDLVHFRSVCSLWRSSAPSRLQHVSLKCPLPPDEGGLGDGCHIVKRCVYLLKSPNSEVHPRYWLFKLREEKNGRLVLQDLFDGRSLSELGMKYPSLSLDTLHCQVNALKYEHIACYTEWCEPLEFCLEMDFENVGFMQFGGGDNDFAIFGTLTFERFAMYRSLDQCWTVLDPTTRSFQATTSFNGKFYGVDYSGKTTVVKTSFEVTSFQNSMSRERRTRRWLIPSGKELLLC